jgi:spore coat polysaccharide biosynthesis protein SpsF
VDSVVLATGSGRENYSLVELAEEAGCDVFIGSQDNVLERYYLAAKEYGGDLIVRITGDNPFTDAGFASMAVDIASLSATDLCSPQNAPLGTAVEVIGRRALDEAYDRGRLPHHLEHVTPYIKEHPENFKIVKFPVSLNNPFSRLRLTVDTEDDYMLAKIIYESLYRGAYFPASDVINFIKKNPALAGINSSVEQRSMKHSEGANGR